jgi:hypothetical protein
LPELVVITFRAMQNLIEQASINTAKARILFRGNCITRSVMTTNSGGKPFNKKLEDA